MKLNLNQLKATNEVFKRLNILRRWTTFVTEGRYNELAKQSLNCITSYMLASYSEQAGVTVKWERFPKIALYRAYQKAHVYFDTPEYILNEIREVGNIPKDVFNEVTKQLITENADENFANFLCEGIGTYEMKIYRAGTKIATLVELSENINKMDHQEYNVKLQEVHKSLEEFEDLPGFKEISDVRGNVFHALTSISTLRNKNRWAAQLYTVPCSVLGHLFDTAIFAYFIALEEYSGDESVATDMFFMGIFHDVAETWTGDIPSPIKDKIRNFRKATEEYESRMLETKLYNRIPEFIAAKLKTVIIEDESDKYYKIFKGADYLSADSECWRQYKGGSRDEYFITTPLENDRIKIETGKVLVTPVCKELFYMFYNYAKSLNLTD